MNIRGEIIISGVSFLSACSLFYVTTTFRQNLFADKVGPALWPQVVLFTIIILSGSLLIKNTITLLKKEKYPHHDDHISEKEGAIRLIMAIFLSLTYGFGVSFVGFLISVFVFQILFLLILKVKNILVLFFFPLCQTLLLYGIFIKILYIPLPRGVGFFLTFSRIFY